MKLSTIKPNPKNPRLIKDKKFKELCNSIKEFPKMLELRPMIVDANNMILGGNMRYKALKELGYKDIPSEWIKSAESLTDDEKRRFIIQDNIQVGEDDWDMLKLDWHIDELTGWGMDVSFYPKEDAIEDDYEIPTEIETDIVLGDLFEIGEHRLLCGSSTSVDDVKKLMEGGGGYCNIMITDRPYGVNLDQTWRDKALSKKNNGNKNLVKNDDIADWTSAYALFTGTIAYIWHASKFTDVIMKNLRDCNFEPNQQLILNKSVMVMGRNDYHFKHEPCWYAVKKGSNHSWIGNRKQVTVIDAIMPASRAQQSKEDRTEHPTQKPVLCMAIPMKNHSGDVYDPFLGSGTTMVAANQLKRKCYGMELDFKYCEVIAQRMIKLDKTLIIKRNGIEETQKWLDKTANG